MFGRMDLIANTFYPRISSLIKKNIQITQIPKHLVVVYTGLPDKIVSRITYSIYGDINETVQKHPICQRQAQC